MNRTDGRAADERNAHVDQRERFRAYAAAARARLEAQREAPACQACGTTNGARLAVCGTTAADGTLSIPESHPALDCFGVSAVPLYGFDGDAVLCVTCIDNERRSPP